MLTQTLITVSLFIVLLALLPITLKWLQRRSLGGAAGVGCASRVVGAIAVGPHQRVVTVEIGSEGERTWLTLGVTAQSITCLYSAPVPSGVERLVPSATQNAVSPL
jgi:flagellar protein FliO/FliZ